jgi:hypothetical protein
MWTIPSIPHGAHDIDILRPEKPARPDNDPKRRSDSRRSRRHHPADEEEDFEIDTFERHAGEPESDSAV